MKAAALALCLVACAKGTALDHSDGGTKPKDGQGGSGGDDGPADLDGPTGGSGTDAFVPQDAAPHAPGTHLLLSEVVLAPSAAEFIEIVNPTTAAVDLTHYYLSDNGSYWSMATGDANDFIAQFPSGASIPAGGVIVVAIDTTANFLATYGMNPTYSIGSSTMTIIVRNSTASLTNAGEVIALFEKDAGASTVHDVDILLAGQPTSGNGLVAKTGSGYKTDAMTIANQAATPGSNLSTKRIALEATHETQTGAGNGITGDDETSEDTSQTWDKGSFSAPTPGVVPSALLP